MPAPLIEPSTPIVAPARKAAKKKKATKFDRLKYQREYMRKRRAKAKAKKAKRARV